MANERTSNRAMNFRVDKDFSEFHNDGEVVSQRGPAQIPYGEKRALRTPPTPTDIGLEMSLQRGREARNYMPPRHTWLLWRGWKLVVLVWTPTIPDLVASGPSSRGFFQPPGTT